ncbi:hypothetical protein SRHO_G00270740 [Serrasalmus rhombeus]
MCVSFGISETYKELVDIFDEDSENDVTFLGFSDGELSDCNFKDSESDCDGRSTEQVSPKKPAHVGFTLRIALRPRSLPNISEDEDTWGKKTVMKPVGSENHVKLEVDDAPKDTQKKPPSPFKSESDSDESFLEKRAVNIQANKAMLAQLMDDIQKMPGALKKNTGHARKKESRSAPVPRSSEAQRNPERRSRRVTRSMGADDFSTAEGSSELEMSLEEELIKVHAKLQRRESLRPSQGKSHVVRPVKEITEDELQLVATSMTEKIYNRVTIDLILFCFRGFGRLSSSLAPIHAPIISSHGKVIFFSGIFLAFDATICRAPPVISVDRRPWTRRLVAAVRTAVGYRDNFVAHVFVTDMAKMSRQPSLTRNGSALPVVVSATAAFVGSAMVAVPLAFCFPWRNTMAFLMFTPTSAVFIIS